MNRNLALLAIGVLAGGIVATLVFMRTPSPGESPGAPPTVPATLDAGPATPETVRPEQLEEASIEAMRRRVADLELALQASIEMREAAEALLAESERDVEELEAFVEEIKARGEDPTDYAEEGVEKFQPAFFKYQEAFAAFEEAERVDQAARDELARARDALAAREAGGAGSRP